MKTAAFGLASCTTSPSTNALRAPGPRSSAGDVPAGASRQAASQARTPR